MNISDRPYLVIDLEGTCCDDGSIPPDERETIEIGAVLVHSPSLVEVSNFGAIIRPVRHPILTEFCSSLTGITQVMVESDTSYIFPQAFAIFHAWFSHFPDHMFCSWGRYDKEQFGRDFAYHSMQSPFKEHLDLSGLFKRKIGRKRGHRGAMKFFGLQPDGDHHRGLSDARNIAKMLPFLLRP